MLAKTLESTTCRVTDGLRKGTDALHDGSDGWHGVAWGLHGDTNRWPLQAGVKKDACGHRRVTYKVTDTGCMEASHMGSHGVCAGALATFKV